MVLKAHFGKAYFGESYFGDTFVADVFLGGVTALNLKSGVPTINIKTSWRGYGHQFPLSFKVNFDSNGAINVK